MAKLTTDELLEAFKSMTLIELSEFVKMFEETFDVTAAAPVAVAAAAPAAGSSSPSRATNAEPAAISSGPWVSSIRHLLHIVCLATGGRLELMFCMSQRRLSGVRSIMGA